MVTNFVLNFDGSIGPRNPGGTAAYGYILRENVEGAVWLDRGVIGTGPQYTNNYAELYGLYKGLEQAYCAVIEHRVDVCNTILSVQGDSQLAINLMTGKYRPKKDKLYYPAYELAKKELTRLEEYGILVIFSWVPREQNKEADELAQYTISKLEL